MDRSRDELNVGDDNPAAREPMDAKQGATTKNGELRYRRRAADGGERLSINDRRMPIDQVQCVIDSLVQANWSRRRAVISLHLGQQLARRAVVVIVRILVL